MARTNGRNRPADRGETSLDAAMRAPSTTTPDVVVLDFVEEEVKAKDTSDPEKDLWLSTCDGRYQSPIIPVRVGPHAETFPVHLSILRKSEYFRRALDGTFREAEDQAIDLPEEDPSIFGFLVAWLYEEKFVPIKPVARVLVKDEDKGKGKEGSGEGNANTARGEEDADVSDSVGSASDDSTRSRRRNQRRRRLDRAWEQRQRKQPNRHRPECNCAACTTETIGPPCWSCGARALPDPRPPHWNGPRHRPPPHPVILDGRYIHPRAPRERERIRRRGSGNGNNADNILPEEEEEPERMSPEDLRTWCLAYTLSIDVYVCADRYLLSDFKTSIAAYIINNFEIAGLDAAQPAILYSCKTLHDGISALDPLSRKVFARVGFLQARLWKNFPQETSMFFEDNPRLAMCIMREMVERREEDIKDDLPAMERPVGSGPAMNEDVPHYIERPRRYNAPYY
ncbi:Uncharacterized protein BP5553_06086 [Venustampulla echinocandica]|uniref:BTB domain-containing protein n=1 Tax=Venustampulla echinocandica TaxID=2656787 RepID=A0A370TMJ0_9HELO|nr:Uncharacterized protein BP5553_06086 [Venustampulla echinocandica]RDL36734.1 Uncharacterized protein BP5553_06086 [Venustampulla echinocandica]